MGAVNWKRVALAGWGAAIVACFLLFRSPSPARVEIKTVTKEVVKWKTTEHIVTRPGATVYLAADGSTTITGPVEIGRTSEGSASRYQESNTKMDSGWNIALWAGAALPRPALCLGADYRIGTLFNRVGIGAGVWGELPVGIWIPNRGGVRLSLTF